MIVFTVLSYPLTGPPGKFIMFSVVETGVSRNAGNGVGKSNQKGIKR